MKKVLNYSKALIIPLILIGLWELYSTSKSSPVYFPSISSIISRLIELFGLSEFIGHIISTLYRCFLGFLFAMLIAVPFGILLGYNKKIYHLFQFIIEFLRPLPSASIIPISILFLGIDDSMKVFVIFFGSLWPILINTMDGVLNIEPQYLKTAKVFNISTTKTLSKVVFPTILPHIFTGIKISVAIALILAITVEMIVGGNGLGFFILDAERSFQFKDMYAGVLTIGLLGYIINVIFINLEKWVIYWKR
jgi:ABC-type nitrate/sulfonate/bicarbonate transport system permease component